MGILEAQEVSRWYGQVVGLNDLTVSVGCGVTGLLGPNGAGKSTLLKLIVGELKPSSGSLTVLGEAPFANQDFFRRIGFVPQQDALYENWSGFDMVRFLMRLAGHGPAEARNLSHKALERVGMTEHMQRACRGYSKGMRQRVKIAQAIANDPELLVLDEPLTGLDPIARRDVIHLLHSLDREGTHVLVSSHILHEIEAITSEVLLLHRGRLLAKGQVGQIRDLLLQHPRVVQITTGEPRRLAAELVHLQEVLSLVVDSDGQRLTVETRDPGSFLEQLTHCLARDLHGVEELSVSDASLEAVFDYLVA